MNITELLDEAVAGLQTAVIEPVDKKTRAAWQHIEGMQRRGHGRGHGRRVGQHHNRRAILEALASRGEPS